MIWLDAERRFRRSSAIAKAWAATLCPGVEFSVVTVLGLLIATPPGLLV
jgi:hypothetical protein